MENTVTEEVVKKVITWIESSADFVKGELPDFVEQLMAAAKFKVWFDIAFISLFIFILISIAIFCIYKNSTMEKSYDNIAISLGCFMPFAIILPCVGGLISEIHTLINIYLAPKVYILTHLKDFLK